MAIARDLRDPLNLRNQEQGQKRVELAMEEDERSLMKEGPNSKTSAVERI